MQRQPIQPNFNTYVNQIDFGKYFKRMYLLLAEYYWVVLLLLAILVFRKIAVVLIFIVLAALPQSYKRFIRFPLGFELLTFFTIVMAYWQGAFIAWICTFPMVMLSVFFSGRPMMPKYRFMKYALICLFIYGLSHVGTNIALAGRITTIIINAIGITMAGLLRGAKSIRTLPAKLINISLNFYVFGHFGQALLNALNYL
ncbi:hypothetical protein ACFLYT_01195 [Nanoarchaeota archaeon]